MTCLNCGFNVESDQVVCPNCKENPQLKVLTRQEREDFQGLTIEQNNNQHHQDQDQYYNTNSRVYIRHINLSNIPGGFLLKLLLGLGFLFIIVIALPVALFLIVFLGMIWLLNRPTSR